MSGHTCMIKLSRQTVYFLTFLINFPKLDEPPTYCISINLAWPYVSLLTLESLVCVTVAVTDCPRPLGCSPALTQYELHETTITIQHNDTKNFGTNVNHRCALIENGSPSLYIG